MSKRKSSLKIEIPGKFIGEAIETPAILTSAVLLIFAGVLLGLAKGWIGLSLTFP